MAKLRRSVPVPVASRVDADEMRRRLRHYASFLLVVVDPDVEDHPEVVQRKRVAAELTRAHRGLAWDGSAVLADHELERAVERIEADFDRVGYLEGARRRHEHSETLRASWGARD